MPNGTSDALLEGLLTRLGSSDTPYRAWAAVALTHATDARHRPWGGALLRHLRDELPPLNADLEQGDLVAYAIIASECLTTEERTRIARALPLPHVEQAARSRFYDSPLYVYAAARWLATELPDAVRLATFAAESAAATAERAGTDITDLTLRLATVFELAGASPVPDALLRAVHARLVAQPGDPQAAIVLRWLLERYRPMWPATAPAKALRVMVEGYVEVDYPTSLTAEALRLEVAAMQLETVTVRSPEYRFVSRDQVAGEVSARIGRQRVAAALAYAFCLAVLCVVPPVWLALYDGLPWVSAASGALGLWVPAACWSTLAALGRRRRDGAFASAVALAVAYNVFAAYAALSEDPKLLDFASKDALFAFIPVVITTVFGALPARE
jgi:hypothetical protein